MSDRPDVRTQRERSFIAILDEKIESIRQHHCDQLFFDEIAHNGGLRHRTFSFRLGNKRFLLAYHESQQVPGSAIFRYRMQEWNPHNSGEEWVELLQAGDLDAALREAKKTKGKTAADIKAERNSNKHDGPRPSNIIIEGYTGSRAYNLQHEGYVDPTNGLWQPPSDLDTRGVFVVPTVDVLKIGGYIKLVEDKKTDTKFDEVQRFIEMCLKGNPERLEMLATPKIMETEEGRLITDNQHIFLSRAIISTYAGYSRSQLYRIDTKAERWSKPLMHLIRLMLTGIRILKDSRIDPDMSEYRERMMAIRRGEMPSEEVLAWHQQLEVEFGRLAEKTTLPEKPDLDKANQILLEIRQRHTQWL